MGTSAGLDSKVWFTVAKGITSEVFYPRLDVPNMEDMQYVVTDGSTVVDLERDATSHAISMPTEKALEYTVTNTDMRPSPKYRITNTYIVDPSRDSLLIRTRFESLDGGVYRLYLLANPSMAGAGANNKAWWDGTNSALMASGTRSLFGSPTTVVSALKVGSPTTIGANDNGFATMASDCNVELHKNMGLISRFDQASDGNVVQCGEIVGVGADTTFTIALGYGGDAATALAAAEGSLAAGFPDREASYRKGWSDYVDGLRPAPSSVSSDTLRRRVYYTAAMALHAAEDKTFRGGSVAGFGTPWGDFVNGDQPNDGYHRVWGRDLYQQAMGLIAAGDSSQALRMAQFLWRSQFVGTTTPGDGTTYQPGSFPRYTPVSGIGAATAKDLGCCEQLDEEAFAILLAWMTGLSDSSTYQKIKTTADHITGVGPATTERWEEQFGQSPSSIAAIIAGLVAAADIARQNNDPGTAARWESTADSWRSSLADRTYTTDGYWGSHRYFERIDPMQDPNGSQTIHFDEGDFLAHDIADFGFLDLVRLGVIAPDDANVSSSLSPSASASDGNSTVQVTMPSGDIYFHRYNHDNYGESNNDCTGWPAGGSRRYGRFWPVLQGNAGNTKSRTAARQMSTCSRWLTRPMTATSCPSRFGTVPTSPASLPGARPAARLLSTGLRANICVSPSRSTLVTTSTRRPWSKRNIAARVQSSALPASALTMPARARTTERRSRFSPATERPRRAGPGTARTAHSARSASVSTSRAARPPAERRFSSGTATAQALRNGAGDSRPNS